MQGSLIYLVLSSAVVSGPTYPFIQHAGNLLNY